MDIVYLFDLFGTIIFAITGAVKGVRLRLDVLGVMIFAITVGCAGGMVRDAMLGVTPVSSLKNGTYLISCIITGIVVLFIAPKVVGKWRIILYCDAIGLGVFTSIGCEKAMLCGVGPCGQILCGAIGAVGGGVIRDVFSKETPSILTTDFYATPTILGGALYVILEQLPFVSISLRFVLCASFVIILRMWAIHCNVNLPRTKMFGDDEVSGSHI